MLNFSAKAFRVKLSSPVTVQWRWRGQHGALWYPVLNPATGEPITFDTVPAAQEWIKERSQ